MSQFEDILKEIEKNFDECARDIRNSKLDRDLVSGFLKEKELDAKFTQCSRNVWNNVRVLSDPQQKFFFASRPDARKQKHEQIVLDLAIVHKIAEGRKAWDNKIKEAMKRYPHHWLTHSTAMEIYNRLFSLARPIIGDIHQKAA